MSTKRYGMDFKSRKSRYKSYLTGLLDKLSLVLTVAAIRMKKTHQKLKFKLLKEELKVVDKIYIKCFVKSN